MFAPVVGCGYDQAIAIVAICLKNTRIKFKVSGAAANQKMFGVGVLWKGLIVFWISEFALTLVPR